VGKDEKDPSAKPPQGAFSSDRKAAPPPPAKPSERKRGDEIAPPDAQRLPAGFGASLFPPSSGPPPGSEEVVLADIAANDERRPSTSSFPPPLGQSEGHDAWTVERMSRQSTVPPVRSEEVDRLRELAVRSSLRPEPIDEAGEGDALDLVERSRPSQQLDLVGEMEELYALDDLTGALRFAELVLGREPDNEQARRCAENCRRRLLALYSSKIGNLQAVPVPAMTETELRWLGLDHRSGFLLSRVDGMVTVEEVLDVCGMPRLEALKTLVDLLDRGAIRVENR
jgi:hypothetical protein